MEEFTTIGRPGYFGNERNKTFENYDNQYGKSNWRIMWRHHDKIIPFVQACYLYQNSYLEDSFLHHDKWDELRVTARDVYDIEEKDVESGLDYLVQKGIATHIQDIVVRNIFAIKNWKFEGKELVQVRKHGTYWGDQFSPGKIAFNEPEIIVSPHLTGWWDFDSVEDFYQSNKVLQVRNK